MRRMRLAASLMLGLAAATMPVMRAQAQVSIGMSITIAPPILPVYEQPAIPDVGYIWAPGYWAYSDVGYYWVPGTWVLPPQPGLLWTPGYWACDDGVYAWNAGYWAPQVGFYGGVNYGYGYTGNGYQGGYWRQNHFYYNRNVNNFGNTHITNVYEHNVTNVTVNRISYNGGNGGINARPDQQQMSYQNEHHFDPTPDQRQQEHLAAGNRNLWASQNHGVPPIAATPRPADFSNHGVVAAHNAPVNVQEPPQHTGNMMAPQQGNMGVPHPENMGVPHPESMGTPHVVEPGNMGMNRPENIQHAQPAPQVYHPQEAAPVQHQPTPQVYHPQEMQAPRPQEEPHPQAMQPPHPQEAPHPAAMQAPRPQEAPHPEGGGGQHPQGGEHKPN